MTQMMMEAAEVLTTTAVALSSERPSDFGTRNRTGIQRDVLLLALEYSIEICTVVNTPLITFRFYVRQASKQFNGKMQLYEMSKVHVSNCCTVQLLSVQWRYSFLHPLPQQDVKTFGGPNMFLSGVHSGTNRESSSTSPKLTAFANIVNYERYRESTCLSSSQEVK